jgi:hypothetical protein
LLLFLLLIIVVNSQYFVVFGWWLLLLITTTKFYLFWSILLWTVFFLQRIVWLSGCLSVVAWKQCVTEPDRCVRLAGLKCMWKATFCLSELHVIATFLILVIQRRHLFIQRCTCDRFSHPKSGDRRLASAISKISYTLFYKFNYNCAIIIIKIPIASYPLVQPNLLKMKFSANDVFYSWFYNSVGRI